MAWLASGFFYERFVELEVIDELGDAGLPLGIAILACGAMLSFSAYRAQIMRGLGHPFAFTGREIFSRPTTKLLIDGVYFWSRNPMNLGDTMIYVGLSIVSGCDGGLVINTPLYYFSVWFNSRFLERKGLIERFGSEFLDYERTTSLIIPGPKTIKKVVSKIG